MSFSDRSSNLHMHIPREACGSAGWGKWSSGLHSPDTNMLGFAHTIYEASGTLLEVSVPL
jgi:hypothetical protein